MKKISQLYDDVVKKTQNGENISYIDKNGVKVPKLTVFEDIIVRNLDNLDQIAIEVNETRLTYKEFFREVEKYMSSFKNLGLKENDIVSLCLPVGVEFICAYFALTTLGIACNALNIMFLASHGVKAYLDERCSHTLIIDENYYKLLQMKGAMNDPKLKTLIVTGDETYNHLKSNKDKIIVPGRNISGMDILSFTDFLNISNPKDVLKAVEYNENRVATLNYTSGTTGKAKCMAHSDLAPLFLVAAHDGIKREEYRGDRTLLTIPLQHPTGLFYAMVFQLAQGKTLVLEPVYDKRLFSKDIISKEINHAVQAKPFYAQLVQDRADGLIKPGDFINFRNPYSGGEGFPLSVCKDVNETLKFAGCPNPLTIGYGRSEEGSSTLIPYHIEGRLNTVGVPLPGIKAKLMDPDTLEDIPFKEGAKGEILVSTPVTPLNHCYLDEYNKPGKSDDSIVDSEGNRWARARDVATVIKCDNGDLSYLVLGRESDNAYKDNKKIYLFDLKEQINELVEIQECEVLKLNNEIITVHVVLKKEYKNNYENVIRKIYEIMNNKIDGVKLYDAFGINATSGKCDREAMQANWDNYYALSNYNLVECDFVQEEKMILKRIKK